MLGIKLVIAAAVLIAGVVLFMPNTASLFPGPDALADSVKSDFGGINEAATGKVAGGIDRLADVLLSPLRQGS